MSNFKIVPREPTVEMLQPDIENSAASHYAGKPIMASGCLMGDIWRAMYDAATGFAPVFARGLSFNELREANAWRLPLFRNKHGAIAHSKLDGSDWSPAQWLQAVIGELGEYANLRKKFERGDLTAEEFQREAADELADVQTYLDILAMQLGIDLGRATVAKFNRVSKRVGCNVFLSDGR